jgi:hypothetical protein
MPNEPPRIAPVISLRIQFRKLAQLMNAEGFTSGVNPEYASQLPTAATCQNASCAILERSFSPFLQSQGGTGKGSFHRLGSVLFLHLAQRAGLGVRKPLAPAAGGFLARGGG